MREIKITDQFQVQDDHARNFTVIEYTEFVTYRAKGQTVEVEGSKFYQTAEGDDVVMSGNEGQFQIVPLNLDTRRIDGGEMDEH